MPSEFFKADPVKTAPWENLVVKNIPGTGPIGVPFYIAQGTGDTTVDPSTTVNFVSKLCRNGTVVRFQEFPKLDHSQIPKASAGDAIKRIGDRFAGKRAPNTC